MNWRGAFASLLLAWLAACGGGAGEPDLQRFAAAMYEQAGPRRAAAAGGAQSIDVSVDVLFNWAEWKYPELFPKGPATDSVRYQGSLYWVRAYATGNLLGVADSVVFAYGPLTNNKLKRVGEFFELAALVRADTCAFLGVGCTEPEIGTQPLNVHSLAGQSATFTVSATSKLPMNFKWQVSTDGGASYADLPGATAASYQVAAAGLADDGKRFRVLVSNRDGIAVSATATLTVRSPAAPDYFPVLQGARWTYRRSDSSQPDIVRVVGTRSVEGAQLGAVFETVDGRDRSVWQEVYVASADGVRQYLPDSVDPVDRVLNGLQLLRLPAVKGEAVELVDQIVASDVDVDLDGQPDQLRVQSSLQVVGSEAVSTPAAQFNNALHQRHEVLVTVLSSGSQAAVFRAVVDVWFVDGVGQVKWIARTTAPRRDEATTYLLEGYEVGPLRSDVTAPRLRRVQPEGPTQSTAGSAWASLDEHIDPASVGSDTLIVTDSQGRRVAGTVQVNGTVVAFTPERAVAPGDYSATLAPGIRDLWGNPLAAGRAWKFSVDPTKPAIMAVVPVDGSRDVELAATVVITFSEPPLPETVNERSIYLSGARGGPVDAIRSIRGNTVVVTPRIPLDPASTYRVTVSDITDAAGNALTQPKTWTFETVPGRFAAPVTLSGGMAFASNMAVGDLNGDGLADVVGNAYDVLDASRSGLFVQYGRPDRTLGEPLRVAGGWDPKCRIYNFALGDLNNDGRTDLVMAGDCGVLVLQQSAEGVLVHSQHVKANGVGPLLAELDGNGKPVLLTHENGADIRLWRRSAAGLYEPSDKVATGLSVLTDIVASDFNGDGRPDLVILDATARKRTIAVLTRLPNGGFAPAQHLSADYGAWLPRYITVADINGDGRADIVATLEVYRHEGGLAVFYQTGAGGFGEGTQIAWPAFASAIVAADINRDGLMDLVVLHQNAIGIALQRPDGTLGPEERYAAPFSSDYRHKFVAADVDGDGLLDIVINGGVLKQLPQAAAPTAATAAPVRASRSGRTAARRRS